MERIDINLTSIPFMELLRNLIDITRVPFSDRGSGLLVYQSPGESRLYVKLAERLADLEPGIDAYVRRRPFIRDLCFIDENGDILAFGLPANSVAGLGFNVLPEFRLQTESGGELKSVRNLGYASNGEVRKNRIMPEGMAIRLSALFEPVMIPRSPCM